MTEDWHERNEDTLDFIDLVSMVLFGLVAGLALSVPAWVIWMN